MPETPAVLLPINLVTEKKFINKTIYMSDYCSRRRRIPERRHVRTKETPLYSMDAFNPTTRFYNDHFQTTSHRELKKHCQKILNTIERSSSRKGFQGPSIQDARAAYYDGFHTIPGVEDGDQPLADVLPMSLRRIESEWQKEAIATKRDRGDIYGRAGAKMWYHQREREDARKRRKDLKVVPGLSKWLNEANENEKIAVHSFMKNVSNTVNAERDTKAYRNDLGLQHASHKPNMEDYLDFIPDQNEELESLNQLPPLEYEQDIANTQQLTQVLDFPTSHDQILDETEATKQVIFRSPTHETIPPDYDNMLPSQRCLSPASVSSIYRDITFSKTQLMDDGDPSAKRPQSASFVHADANLFEDITRPNSSLGIPIHNPRPASRNFSASSRARPIHQERNTEAHYHNFPNSNCESCEGNEVRQIANRLAGMKPESYKSMKDEMKRRPQMAISKMYKSSIKDYAHVPEDFVYMYSIFGKTTSNGKSHFTIHPEWVSERKNPRKSFR